MDFCGKSSGPVTPLKYPQSSRSKVSQIKDSENLNPNFTSPDSKLSNSAAIKFTKKAQKSAAKNPKPVASPSPRNKIRERKFVVAKKKCKREKSNSSAVVCKCNISGKSQKCVCVAYETLPASLEEFFGNRANTDDYPDIAEYEIKEEEGMNPVSQNPEISDGYEENLGRNDCLEKNGLDELEVKSEAGSTTLKRRRDKLLEEARQSVPEPGSRRVMHLVKAFEKLLSIPKSKESDEKDDKESQDSKKGMKWALPGLQPKAPETQVSSSSCCPSEFFLTSESLGLDSRVCYSLDSIQGSFVFFSSFTVSSRISGGGRRSRRNSLESSGTFGGRQWKRRQHKVTSQNPFKLRTEV